MEYTNESCTGKAPHTASATSAHNAVPRYIAVTCWYTYDLLTMTNKSKSQCFYTRFNREHEVGRVAVQSERKILPRRTVRGDKPVLVAPRQMTVLSIKNQLVTNASRNSLTGGAIWTGRTAVYAAPRDRRCGN